MLNGIDALNEFLGENCQPVEKHVAQSRATTCERCPRNSKISGFKYNLTAVVAESVRRHKEIRNALDLSLENESKLGICSACECHLPTKVFVPIESVKKRTNQEVMNKLPAMCWIKKETNEIQSNKNSH